MNKKTFKKYLLGDFTLRRLLRSLVFIYVCLLLFALVWSDRMIFQPQACSYSDGSNVIKIEMGNGSPISAMYFDNPNADYTVLYNHANAVDLGDIRWSLGTYRDQGFSVLSYDYCGYGTSPGRPTTANACKAADAALDYLLEQQGIPLNRIIIHGRSVGAGPALYLAEKHDVAGLIVENAFVSAFRVLTRVPLAPFDKFRNMARIDEVNCPVLVIHGRDDTTIPFWHGQKLFEKANEPKVSCWLDDSNHDYVSPEAEEAYWVAVASFVDLIDGERKSVASERGTNTNAPSRAP